MKKFASKLLSVFLSVSFGIVVFLGLDWYRTTRVQAASLRLTGQGLGCFTVFDPTRVFALTPYCSCIRQWGGEHYPEITNSLAFRDTEMRVVPSRSARPRVLMLGDSFTEGMVAWKDSFVGKIAANFPQYEFLNGGVGGYSPSNYLNTARFALSERVEFDEAIVFIDISDAQDEAAYYRDVGPDGQVGIPPRHYFYRTWYSYLRMAVSDHFLMTNYLFELAEKAVVRRGYYHLDRGNNGNEFDFAKSAWTYRPVSDQEPFEAGYAPLGLEGGIAKEKAKMTELWQTLGKLGIPISVVVFPYPAQIVHDTVDSRQVRIWRDWCDGRCKRFVSVFPEFFAASRQCPGAQPGCWYLKYFVFGDIHYNAAGNTVVAETVGRSLAASPVIKR